MAVTHRVFAALAATVLSALPARADFNYSMCPNYWETEYYEIYMRDWLEQLCPNYKCISSEKVYQEEYPRVKDTFTVECVVAGQASSYPTDQYDNFTDQNALFDGYAPNFLFGGRVYPNMIVAISEDTVINKQGKEQYSWLIEFQCLFDKVRGVYYIGINAECYTPDPSDDLKKQIYDAAVEQLNVYADSKDFYEVSQQNCSYPFR